MILDRFKLDGRIALVTGSTRGIGQAAAVALAEAGADIVALDRSDAAETKAMVEGAGRRFTSFNCDMATTTAAEFNELITQVASEMGHLDILINNAGIIRRADVLEFT